MRYLLILAGLSGILCGSGEARAAEPKFAQAAREFFRKLLEAMEEEATEQQPAAKEFQQRPSEIRKEVRKVASQEEYDVVTRILGMKIEVMYDIDDLKRYRQMYADLRSKGHTEKSLEEIWFVTRRPVIREQFRHVPRDAWPVIGKLTSLERLSILFSEMPGDAWKAIAALPNLHELSIGCIEHVSGDLSQLRNLQDLETLEIGFDFVHHDRLYRKKMLGRLTEGEVAYREEYLRKWPARDVAWAEVAIVTDRLLEQLAPLQKLKSINVQSLSISKRGVRALTSFPALEEMSISLIVDDIETSKLIGSCTHLKKLNGARFNDTTFAQLGKLQDMEDLDSCSSLTDASVSQFLRWNRLRSIKLWENALSDAGLRRFAELKGLKHLDIRRSKTLTLEGVLAFRKLRPDCKILFTDSDVH